MQLSFSIQISCNQKRKKENQRIVYEHRNQIKMGQQTTHQHFFVIVPNPNERKKREGENSKRVYLK